MIMNGYDYVCVFEQHTQFRRVNLNSHPFMPGNSTAAEVERKEPSRHTISLPWELMEFAKHQANQPQHAGNMSSYVRSLIIRDQADAEPKPGRNGRR